MNPCKKCGGNPESRRVTTPIYIGLIASYSHAPYVCSGCGYCPAADNAQSRSGVYFPGDFRREQEWNEANP